MLKNRANAIRVGRVVVVRIAIVVHISEIARRDNTTKPPVRAIKDYPMLFICFSCLVRS